MTRRIWTRWTVMALVCVAPLSARAQTTKPAAAADDAPASQKTVEQRMRERRAESMNSDGRPEARRDNQGGPNGPGGPDGGGGGGFRPPPFDGPTAEEWDKSEAFIKEHAPKRFGIMQGLDEEQQQRVRGFIFFRFRQIERLRTTDPEMYQINLKRLGLEDDLFGLRFPIRQEGRLPTAEEMSKMREKVTALIDTNVEERDLRVQRLRTMLKREEDFLTAERAGRDSAINERMMMIEQGRGLGMGRRSLDGGVGPNGPGGGGGGYPGGGPPPVPPPQAP